MKKKTTSAWRATLLALGRDEERLRAYFATVEERPRGIVRLRRGFVAVLLYRLARHCQEAGWSVPARLLWLLNLCVTGADLSPLSSIGSGLVVPYPRTVTVYGTVGADCTFLGQTGIGGAVRGRLGLPVIGDGVVVQPGSIILGGILVGDGARIGPRCVLTKDVPPGGVVAPLPYRTVRRAGPGLSVAAGA